MGFKFKFHGRKKFQWHRWHKWLGDREGFQELEELVMTKCLGENDLRRRYIRCSFEFEKHFPRSRCQSEISECILGWHWEGEAHTSNRLPNGI